MKQEAAFEVLKLVYKLYIYGMYFSEIKEILFTVNLLMY